MTVKFTIEGIEHVTATLGKSGQVVAEEMHKGFDQVARMMQRVAVSEVPAAPLSNWGVWHAASGRKLNVTRGTETRTYRDLAFNAGDARSKLPMFVTLKKKAPQVASLGAYVGDQSAPAAIYEKAGKKPGSKPGRGRTFKANLNNKRGEHFPRILGPAGAKGESWGMPYLERVLADSVRKIQTMMDGS
jgi:hypothetical protein